jgi:hypothetical protein
VDSPFDISCAEPLAPTLENLASRLAILKMQSDDREIMLQTEHHADPAGLLPLRNVQDRTHFDAAVIASRVSLADCFFFGISLWHPYNYRPVGLRRKPLER